MQCRVCQLRLCSCVVECFIAMQIRQAKASRVGSQVCPSMHACSQYHSRLLCACVHPQQKHCKRATAQELPLRSWHQDVFVILLPMWLAAVAMTLLLDLRSHFPALAELST